MLKDLEGDFPGVPIPCEKNPAASSVAQDIEKVEPPPPPTDMDLPSAVGADDLMEQGEIPHLQRVPANGTWFCPWVAGMGRHLLTLIVAQPILQEVLTDTRTP